MTEPIIKRKIKRILTNKGWVCQIPTSDNPNGPYVTVSSRSWNVLLDAGIYPILKIDKDGYCMVWCPSHRRYVRLARLIGNCREGDRCSIIDQNELNLLDDNIHVTPPEPRIYDRSYLSREDMPYAATVVEYETIWPEGDPNNTRFKQTIE